MAYPDDIIVPQAREDGGTTVTEAGKTIGAVVANAVVLDHYARGREIQSDGRVLSSSITVSKGGLSYTETFETPVAVGNYFYHYEDASPGVNSSVLLFNTADAGAVDITYETRGDYITAAKFNRLEDDLEAIEGALGTGLLAFQSGTVVGSGSDVDIDVTAVDPVNIDSIVCLLSAESGNAYAFTVAVDNTKVTITAPTGTVHYLLVLKA